MGGFIMQRKLLGMVGVFVFGSFAATSGALAAPQDTPQVAESVTQKVEPLQMSFDVTPDRVCDEYADPIRNPDVLPLATYQDCVNTCKAGIVAIEAMCRFIPDPRAKALCWAARFTTPACIGFCGWYYSK
jgi:hypothetical protein